MMTYEGIFGVSCNSNALTFHDYFSEEVIKFPTQPDSNSLGTDVNK